MPDNPRIEELRRRVQKDPASIAFAQLAEEYRRLGNYEDAIAVCRAGLETHPSYLSARVTLGRALIEVQDLTAAEAELLRVLQHAPENLSAVRGMAEIHHRRGELGQALTYYQTALGLARHDPDLEQTVEEISRSVVSAPAPALPQEEEDEGLSFEFLEKVFDDFMAEPALVGSQPDPALPGLERFLDAIHSYRQRRAV